MDISLTVLQTMKEKENSGMFIWIRHPKKTISSAKWKIKMVYLIFGFISNKEVLMMRLLGL